MTGHGNGQSSDPGTDEPQSDLKERVFDALVENLHLLRFLPADKIKKFTSRETVETELQEEGLLGSDDADRLVAYASGRGKLVFLTLTYIENLQAIDSLRQNGFDDSHLPVGYAKRKSEKKIPGRKRILYDIGPLDEVSNLLRPTRWDSFLNTDLWSNRTLETFELYQWLFLAPIFTKDRFQHVFSEKRPLPFIRKEGAPKVGFFSRVYQVEIHEAHQHVLAGMKTVVVKQLEPDKDKYFYQEAKGLQVISAINNPSLIKPIAAYRRGDALCFLFPWANGGNLREYWASADKGYPSLRPRREPDLILWVLTQLRGLADGLNALYGENCRHGDLKPENILRFTENNERGTLQIADVGLARFHLAVMRSRNVKTTTMTGTFRYEPPEAEDRTDGKARSRDYDIWSMGCIYLEFLIWLLEGHEKLEEFNEPGNLQHFWEHRGGSLAVHSAVEAAMDRIGKALRCDDPKVDTALKDVHNLVRKRLLKVRLIGDGWPKDDARANAPELSSEMDKIYKRAKSDSSYLFEGSVFRRPLAPSKTPAMLGIPPRADRPKGVIGPTSTDEDYHPRFNFSVDEAPDNGKPRIPISRLAAQEELDKLNDMWESVADPEFAKQVLRQVDWASVTPKTQVDTKLCNSCRDMDFLATGFKHSHDLSSLQENSESCDLCDLYYQLASMTGGKNPNRIEFQKQFEKSALEHGPNGLPILSIYVEPDSAPDPPPFAQLGFPCLPEQGGPAQVALLNEWLRNCDENHGCLPDESKRGQTQLPTRVIHVTGDASNFSLRLIESNDQDSPKKGKYIALSHCWGLINESSKFCTYKSNLGVRKQRIEYGNLPRTFRDAVRITLALGVPYLWIDSLCIIQDDAQDWSSESGRMEDVFSSAYCTIAASSAPSSLAGFLGPREPRPCLRVASSRGTFYICKAIDDFQRDVAESVLNRRGWVLQEWALSRRTIHFTSTQVYWECGSGVHCETLAKLFNGKAAFLGDSDFPNSALHYFKGGRIRLFESLYMTYSRLGFTKQEDKPVALSGLEKRLVRTYDTKGGYGIFESYLGRALLWRRPDSTPLTPIVYPADRKVPSWSWMAYSGGIEYVSIGFGAADWTSDVWSPFQADANKEKQYWKADKNSSAVELRAMARRLQVSEVEFLRLIIFDQRFLNVEMDELRCVVIGKEKKRQAGTGSTHWALVLRPLDSQSDYPVYERVGVGYLLSSHVGDEKYEVRIR